MSKLRALRLSGPTRGRLPLKIVAARAGCSIGHLCDVENGKERASDRLTELLAKVYRKPAWRIRHLCDAAYAEARDAVV